MQSGHALAQAAIAQRGRVDGQPQQQRQHAPAQLQRGFVAGARCRLRLRQPVAQARQPGAVREARQDRAAALLQHLRRTAACSLDALQTLLGRL